MASITKRGNSYRIKVSCGYDINAKQLTKSMTWTPDAKLTIKQVEKELQRQVVMFEEKCKTGQFLDGTIRLADFIDIWWNEYALKQLKAKTLKGYEEYLKRIIPALGHLRLNKIQPMHLLSFYDNLAEAYIRKDIKYKSTSNLTELIKNADMSKAQFAKNASISENALYSACKGNNISMETANKISSLLNIEPDKLFIPIGADATLSGKTILHHHRLISTILQTAVQWQAIPHNPCDRVKAPRAERKESKFLDDTEVMTLFHCLENEPLQYKTAITLYIYSGLRRGELCGLKWADVDFENNIIQVNRNMLYLPEKGIFEDTTKNYSSKRVIKIAGMVMQLLQLHKKEQSILRLKCGDQWNDLDYIFTQWNGNVVHPDSFTAWFRKFIIKYDLPKISIHSLRHTNATLLIANGVNITTVSKRLGHSSTNTTARVYAHAIKSADEKAADTLQNILEPNHNDQTKTNIKK